WYVHVRPATTKAGIVPFAAYVIREKGKIELGNNACGFCHTRVMPNGVAIKGAQGNFAFDRSIAFGSQRATFEQLRLNFGGLAGAPWLKRDDPAARTDSL